MSNSHKPNFVKRTHRLLWRLRNAPMIKQGKEMVLAKPQDQTDVIVAWLSLTLSQNTKAK